MTVVCTEINLGWKGLTSPVLGSRYQNTTCTDTQHNIVWFSRKRSKINDIFSALLLVVDMLVHMGERRGVYRVVVWKPDGKRPLVGPRRRWEDNIKMDLKWDVGVWAGSNSLRWRALVNAVINLRGVP